MGADPPHDCVLLLAFGGPTRPKDVRPFLDHVLRDRPIPKERYEEVVRHYDEVGGASPLNRLTFEQARLLADLLRAGGTPLPVYVGMRHWDPFIADTLKAMAKEGRRRAIGLVLAAHRSPASWEAYLAVVDEACRLIGAAAPAVDYVAPWSEHPLFIEAAASRTADALGSVAPERRGKAALVFTAHSIPTGMSDRCGYAESLRRTAALVSRSLNLDSWSMAYTSRSGNPNDPWLEPDIGDHLGLLKRRGAQDVVVSPIGFVSDHVEVLYDLDIAARRVSRDLGVGFHRALTAGGHPAFTCMLGSVVGDVIARA
jgi:protoporphyrin/coproporphyrin ferrochelatase